MSDNSDDSVADEDEQTVLVQGEDLSELNVGALKKKAEEAGVSAEKVQEAQCARLALGLIIPCAAAALSDTLCVVCAGMEPRRRNH